ncbi:MAG: hypothetical protein H0Z35_03175 [Thermoanaerobacteraceae bacterium]|nr:hypothetical protein [Thermoanaerobacteraceae bacterium]
MGWLSFGKKRKKKRQRETRPEINERHIVEVPEAHKEPAAEAQPAQETTKNYKSWLDAILRRAREKTLQQ